MKSMNFTSRTGGLILILTLMVTFLLSGAQRDDADMKAYADSCYAAGDYRQAVIIYRSLLQLSDSTATSMLREQKAMDMLISQNQKVILRQKYGYIGAAVFVAALIVLIGYIFINLSRLEAKNRALYEQISGSVPAIDPASSLGSGSSVGSESLTDPQSSMGSVPERQASCHVSSDSAHGRDEGNGPTSHSDALHSLSKVPTDPLFAQVIAKIRAERLYSDPSFGRDTLLSLLSTNEAYLYTMFREQLGTTVSAFITNLRLEYCICLMKTEKKPSIEDLAISCGFNNARTLQRLFKTKYGMTPSEYLKVKNSNF